MRFNVDTYRLIQGLVAYHKMGTEKSSFPAQPGVIQFEKTCRSELNDPWLSSVT
jgi:hypothetical protein